MKNYKYLVWAGTVALTVVSIFLLVLMNQVLDTATTTNTVSFNGEGKISAKPDVAAVSFSIVTEAATSKAAQDQNSIKSNQITDFLKQQKISDKDIKTTGYNVYPQYSYPRPCPVPMMYPADGRSMPVYPCVADKQQKISGYQVTQSFEVKVRNIDNVGSILDGLVAAGANQVNNLGFKIDNPEKLKAEARDKAIADAKKKADDLKRVLGIRLGKIVNYSENTGGWPIYFGAKAITADSLDGAPAPSIPTGENEITVNVTITYQIK